MTDREPVHIHITAADRVTPLCDGCNEPQVNWIYPARSFELVGWDWNSIGDWAVCNACSYQIERGDLLAFWLYLLGKIRRAGRLKGLNDVQREALMQVQLLMITEFFKARTGPRRAATAADVPLYPKREDDPL